MPDWINSAASASRLFGCTRKMILTIGENAARLIEASKRNWTPQTAAWRPDFANPAEKRPVLEDERMSHSTDAIRTELSPQGNEFLDYWLSLRAGRLLPDRAEFDPVQVKHLLPFIVIHELIDPEIIRLRLVGTGVVSQYGQESTGRNYLDFVEPERRAKASEAIFLVREHPAGMSVTLQSSTHGGGNMLRRTIALPVGDAKEDRKFVYFCSTRHEASERPLTEPAKLAVQSVANRRYFDIGAGIPEFSD
jgi:hypothetical protein